MENLSNLLIGEFYDDFETLCQTWHDKLYVKDGTKATTRCGFNEEPLSLQLQADSLFPHVPKKHKTLLPQSF